MPVCIENFVRLDGNGLESRILEGQNLLVDFRKSPAGKLIEQTLRNKYKQAIEHTLHHTPHTILVLHFMEETIPIFDRDTQFIKICLECLLEQGV